MTSNRSLLFLTYMGMVFIGLSFATTGALLPAIITDLDLRLSEAGVLVAAISAGFLTSVLLSNYLVTVLRRKQVLIFGLFSMILGATTFGIGPLLVLNALFGFLIGFGAGLIEIPLNAITIDLYMEKRSSGLNLLHMFFGVGAILGPKYASTLLAWTDHWRSAYLSNGILFGVLLVLFAFQRLPSPLHRDQRSGLPDHASAPRFHPLRHPTLLLLGLAVTLGVGTEVGINRWLTTYLKFSFSSSIDQAADSLLVYWIGMTLGRFLLSQIIHRVRFRYETLLQIVIGVGIVTLSLGLTVPDQGFATLWFFVTGLCMAGIVPLSLALGSDIHPERPDEMTSVLYTSFAFGGTFSPWLISIIAEATDIRTGMFLSVPLLVVMLVIIQWVRTRSMRERESPSSTRSS